MWCFGGKKHKHVNVPLALFLLFWYERFIRVPSLHHACVVALEMFVFRRLGGEKAFCDVVLATTFWDVMLELKVLSSGVQNGRVG